MENDSMHKKVGMSQVSQLTTKVSIGSVVQITNGPKRGQMGKWDKNPLKDKGTLREKKTQDVAKVQCFNYKTLGHFSKDCKKNNARLVTRGIYCKGKCGQVGPKFNHV
jgi:hypothetical protein